MNVGLPEWINYMRILDKDSIVISTKKLNTKMKDKEVIHVFVHYTDNHGIYYYHMQYKKQRGILSHMIFYL